VLILAIGWAVRLSLGALPWWVAVVELVVVWCQVKSSQVKSSLVELT